MTMGVTTGVRNGAPPPASVTRDLLRARGQLQAGHPADARATLERALQLAPGYADAVRLLGTAAQATGDQKLAARCFTAALKVWPDDADLHLGLGIALFEQGAENEGLGQLRHACRLAPNAANAWYNLGCALKKAAQTEEAWASFKRAAQLDSTHTAACLEASRTLALLGRIDAAIAGFREVLRRDPANADAWFALSNLNILHFSAEETRAIRRLYADTRSGTAAREQLGFTLAKALEDQGDYAAAFDQFTVANAAKRATLQWDASANRRYAVSIHEAFSRPVATPPDRTSGAEVIFIASVPRSGSTLVEHILASHPDVEGANEINELWHVVQAESERRHEAFPAWVRSATSGDWLRLGKTYLERTARWRERKLRCTDKSLVNWRLAGAALTMLPGARVVIVHRNPVETCLACFRQRFAGESGFTCNLDEMADYCIDFARLTAFWLQRFPQRTFDLEYETLVAQPEATIRGLLDFCRLPFAPECLRFHETRRTVLSSSSAAQVRQPLRNDTARAGRYGGKLDGLRARLRAAGLAI
ncbi:MAG TPA: sulfotransferase [Rhodanobacteraceae bacterium]